MNSLFVRCVIGGAAALLAWLLIEPTAPTVITDMKLWESFELRLTLTLGVLLGCAVGGYQGFLQGGKIHTLRGVFLGAFLGAAGISLGQRIGGGIFEALTQGKGTAIIVILIPARFLALTFVGAGLGLGIGGSSLNLEKTKQGLVGGAIGGGIGGLLFDPLGLLVRAMILASRGIQDGSTETGGPSRGLYCLILGIGIALFIGLAERYMRSAWLRLELGRNEGREWSLVQQQTVLGRSEMAQLPLFGDANVAPQHALIQNTGQGYSLVDLGSQIGTGLNGQRIQPQTAIPLMHGARISVGPHQLIFLLKNQATPIKQAMPMQEHYGGAPTPMPIPQPVANFQPTVAVATGFGLLAVEGPLTGQRFAVAMPIDLGREGGAIPLEFDSTVSRRHAQVSPGPGGLQVQDLGSSNGTFVDGQRVQSVLVQAGQHIRIGTSTFRVEPA